MRDPERQREIRQKLSTRLENMASQISRLSLDRCVMAPDDVERVGQEVRDMIQAAREIEARAVFVNPQVTEAFEVLHQAEDSIAGARAVLRERLEHPEIDPTGAIRAALAIGAGLIGKADMLIGGRQSS